MRIKNTKVIVRRNSSILYHTPKNKLCNQRNWLEKKGAEISPLKIEHPWRERWGDLLFALHTTADHSPTNHIHIGYIHTYIYVHIQLQNAHPPVGSRLHTHTHMYASSQHCWRDEQTGVPDSYGNQRLSLTRSLLCAISHYVRRVSTTLYIYICTLAYKTLPHLRARLLR